MVKLVYATCRHCGHKFIPRVEQPRQCGACWGLSPLRDTPSNKKNGPVSETRKKEGK